MIIGKVMYKQRFDGDDKIVIQVSEERKFQAVVLASTKD